MLIQIVIKLFAGTLLTFPFPNSQDTSNRHMHYFLIDKLEKCNLKLGLLKSIDNGSKTASSTTLLLLFFFSLDGWDFPMKKTFIKFLLAGKKKIINWQLLAKITFLLWEPINYTFCALMIFQGKKKCKWISIENQISISFLS